MVRPASHWLREELDAAWSQYQQLASLVPRTRKPGGRRTVPSSRTPIDETVVDLMRELEQLVSDWVRRAAQVTDPARRLQIHIACPGCGHRPLIGDLRAGLIICPSTTAEHDGPRSWTRDYWPRLGVSAGVRAGVRYGRRGARPPVARLAEALTPHPAQHEESA